MHVEHLVTMVNEITAFFHGASEAGQAAESVATHLRRFWDPRVCKQIIEHVQQGGEGLTTLAREGVQLLADKSSATG